MGAFRALRDVRARRARRATYGYVVRLPFVAWLPCGVVALRRARGRPSVSSAERGLPCGVVALRRVWPSVSSEGRGAPTRWRCWCVFDHATRKTKWAFGCVCVCSNERVGGRPKRGSVPNAQTYTHATRPTAACARVADGLAPVLGQASSPLALSPLPASPSLSLSSSSISYSMSGVTHPLSSTRWLSVTR